MGGRLPSRAEWERAARGQQTGARATETWVKDAKGPPLANIWHGVSLVVDTGEDGHHGLAPVGCYAPNDLGVRDRIGNVWEWTASD